MPTEVTDDLRLGRPQAVERLSALGFGDARSALRHVEVLTDGVTRRAALQRALLPSLLVALADTPDPDSALLSYRKVSDALGGTPWFLRLLRDGGEGDAPAVQRLARVLGSRYVADLLTRAPDGAALVADDRALVPKDAAALAQELGATAARHSDPEDAVRALRALRRRELLRVALADVLGVVDHETVMAALSDVSTGVVAAAVGACERAAATEGPVQAHVGVVVAGRTGGREAGYGSDVDLVAVHRPAPGASGAQAQRAAETLVSRVVGLLGRPGPDPPLRLDAQLRPDGRAGPLSTSLASLREYWRRAGQVWEAQALLRARGVAGDAGVLAELWSVVDPLRYPPGGIGDAGAAEVRRIKARVEAERAPRGPARRRHLKLGPGGLADVEWVVQLLQLQHAGSVPALRTTSTLEGLEAAAAAGLLDRGDAAVLAEAWRLTSRLRDTCTLVSGRVTEVLPDGGRDLAGVAHLLGYPPGPGPDAVLVHHADVTARCRSVVERVL